MCNNVREKSVSMVLSSCKSAKNSPDKTFLYILQDKTLVSIVSFSFNLLNILMSYESNYFCRQEFNVND